MTTTNNVHINRFEVGQTYEVPGWFQGSFTVIGRDESRFSNSLVVEGALLGTELDRLITVKKTDKGLFETINIMYDVFATEQPKAEIVMVPSSPTLQNPESYCDDDDSQYDRLESALKNVFDSFDLDEFKYEWNPRGAYLYAVSAELDRLEDDAQAYQFSGLLPLIKKQRHKLHCEYIHHDNMMIMETCGAGW